MQPLYSRLILERLKRSLLIVATIILTILAVSSISLIFSNKNSQMSLAGQSIKSMASILSRESDATLTLAATILEELSTHLKIDADNRFLEQEQIHSALISYRRLINEQTGSSSFSHLFLIGFDGYNVVNSVSYPAKRVDASDRIYFKHHQQVPGKKLNISQPKNSKVTGEKVIYLTRRVSHENGQFCGVIGIQLKLSHFDRMYKQLGIPDDGSVAVLRSDGMGIYRFPMTDSFLETSVAERSEFQKMLQQKSGFIYAPSAPYDGDNRLVGYKLSDKFPIVNIITITEDSLLKSWVDSSIKTLLLAAFAGLTLLILVYFTYQQLRVLDHAIHLSNHDSLTSLWNRRALNHHLEEEWRRLKRRGGDISLLFIDIDYFKNFNDLYGHSKGDLCLKQVARTITQFAERSGEMASRFGGEEFIVLLPESDLKKAYTTANRISRAIQQLSIAHASSEVSDCVTISIGVASIKPIEGYSTSELLDHADEALYQAKAKGRNQIRVYKNENMTAGHEKQDPVSCLSE